MISLKSGKLKNKLNNTVAGISERIGAVTEINEFFPFYMTVNSLGEISVKGCKEITDYSEDGIFLEASSFSLIIKGSDLRLKDYSDKNTVILGRIFSIEFVYGGK